MSESLQRPSDEDEPLTIEDLDIEELELRLELAATSAACQCGKFA